MGRDRLYYHPKTPQRARGEGVRGGLRSGVQVERGEENGGPEEKKVDIHLFSPREKEKKKESGLSYVRVAEAVWQGKRNARKRSSVS